MSALPETSRVAFEAWLAIKDPRPFTPDAYSDQDYKWRGWQASRKQALEEALHITQHINDNCSGAPAGPDEIAEEIRSLK